MASGIQNEDITRVAEGVQRRFLEEYKESVDVDKRDYDRVRTCLPYVCKFVRQKMGDFDSAYEMMTEAMKWRKSFGVQDMNLDQIDSTYFQTGVGVPHGEDKDGCTLLILNCHLHKKDAKKFPQLQRFFVFCMESHARRFPDKKITMLFNMSQCGISNMDMEFVKFIISCFKFYFPDMLNYLLVFEMPWVLQAAWRIIKGWLGEAAIRKIKFVTKSDITEYVSPDQLLIQFGGSDPWKYEYNPDELKVMMGDVWERDPLIIEDNEEEQEESAMEDSIRQVRFAPGQPPSRQSRYGDPDEESVDSSLTDRSSPLRKGTASSPGFRKRQIDKLLTSAQQKPSSEQSLLVGMPSSRKLEAKRSAVSNYHLVAGANTLQINPSDELVFEGDEDDLTCTVTLKNTTRNTVAYKIKTTAPNRYKVKPNVNLIRRGDKATIQVKLLSGTSEVAQDKFLVLAYEFDDGMSPPDPNDLPSYWKALGRDQNVEEYRLKCQYVKRAKQKKVSTSSKGEDIVIVEAKVDQLVIYIDKLQRTVNKVWYACVVIIVLVLVDILLF